MIADRGAPPLPAAFVDRMQGWLGDEAPVFLGSLAEPPVAGLRLNPLKGRLADLAARLAWELAPVPWCPAGFTLPEDASGGRHPYHAAGLYYLQEPTAMLPAEVLAPQPGDWVLDLCGAPGGKATHLAALMAGQGLLVANDVVLGRARILAENLERWGARNAVVLSDTPERLADRWGPAFDRVLVDAPCSGEGMFRKSPAAIRDWSPEQVAGCAVRQGEILVSAARLVRPGGWLAYSTCTFAPEENEGVLAALLDAHPGFGVEAVRSLPGFAPGRPEWAGVEEDAATQVRRAVRLWPHRVEGEGHVVALLRRAESHLPGSSERPGRSTGVCPVAGAAEEAWDAFCRVALAVRPELELMMTGGWLFAAPAHWPQPLEPRALRSHMPDIAGLRVLRPGWHLGTVRKGRFEPGHALALGLSAAEVQRCLDVASDGPDVRRYLRGETLAASLPDGWALVTVDGFALGWTKVVRGVAKNHYPKALRRAWQ